MSGPANPKGGTEVPIGDLSEADHRHDPGQVMVSISSRFDP